MQVSGRENRRISTLVILIIAGEAIFFLPFVMAFISTPGMMRILYALWGFTIICLFWAAMIRATREWGGDDFQGRAFGWLEGGRGVVAALLGTSTFLIFSWFSRAVPDHEVAMHG